jgi:hypothetical protein
MHHHVQKPGDIGLEAFGFHIGCGRRHVGLPLNYPL